MTTESSPKLDIAADAPAVAETSQDLFAELSTGVGLSDARYPEIIADMQMRLVTLDALAKSTRELAE